MLTRAMTKLIFTPQIIVSNQAYQTEDPMAEVFNQDEAGYKIDQVRELLTSLSYLASQKRTVVLSHFDQASSVVQNALLKTLEEPPANTQLILTVENLSLLLPTIRSRCEIQHLSQATSNKPLASQESGQASDFVLPQTCSQAIELAEKYSDRLEALKLIKNLIYQYQNQNAELKIQNSKFLILNSLSQTYSYLQANVNVKLSLEHCFFKLIKENNHA